VRSSKFTLTGTLATVVDLQYRTGVFGFSAAAFLSLAGKQIDLFVVHVRGTVCGKHIEYFNRVDRFFKGIWAAGTTVFVYST
jgi:hypothetical protein